MPSATFTINGSATTAAIVTTAGATVTVALVSTTGVRAVKWRIVAGSDPDEALPTFADDTATSTTFTMNTPIGSEGLSFIVECVINNGVDDAGQVVSSYTATGLVGVVNASGKVPIALGEKFERHNTHGIVPDINALWALVSGSDATAWRGVTIDNTTFSAPNDGDIPVYNSGTGTWVAGAPSSFTLTWAQVLADGALSGGTSPRISAGDAIEFIDATRSLTATAATGIIADIPTGETWDLQVNSVSKLVVSASAVTYHQPLTSSGTTATLATSAGTWLTGTTTMATVVGSLAVGSGPISGTGTIRTGFAGSLYYRNEADSADNPLIRSTTGNTIIVGDDSLGGTTQIRSPSLVQFRAAGGLVASVSATALQAAAGKKFDTASGTAALSIGGTDWMTGTVAFATLPNALRIGATPASVTSGLGLANNTGVTFRNAGDTTNITVVNLDGSNVAQLGNGLVNAQVTAFATITERAGGTNVGIWRATELELQNAIKLDWASGTAALSIGGTNWMTGTVALTSIVGNLAIGTTVASTGTIRLPNLFTIYGRNAANTADIKALTVNASDQINIGDTVWFTSPGTSVAFFRAAELELQNDINMQLLRGYVELGDLAADPSTPTGAGRLYSIAGALYWRGSGGTITPLAGA